jgi:hypothetical protein
MTLPNSGDAYEVLPYLAGALMTARYQSPTCHNTYQSQKQVLQQSFVLSFVVENRPLLLLSVPKLSQPFLLLLCHKHSRLQMRSSLSSVPIIAGEVLTEDSCSPKPNPDKASPQNAMSFQ